MKEGTRGMKQVMSDVASDWLALALAGIGISLPPHEYLGGLFLAMAGAIVARHALPESGRQEWGITLLTAFLVATMAASLKGAHWPGIPAQAFMAGSGFASRFIARVGLAMAGRLESRTNTIFDRMLDRVIPPKSGGPGNGA